MQYSLAGMANTTNFGNVTQTFDYAIMQMHLQSTKKIAGVLSVHIHC